MERSKILTSDIHAGVREEKVTYQHYDPAAIQVEDGRLAPLYLVNLYLDASGSQNDYADAIREFLTQLPEKLRHAMEEGGLTSEFHGRIVIGVFTFSVLPLGYRPNVIQLLPYTPLSVLHETSWAQKYIANGGTPLVDAIFLASEVSQDYSFKLSENGIQTYNVSVIFTDGGDSDFNPFKPSSIMRANQYADMEMAKESLEMGAMSFKANQMILIGIGSEQSNISYITQRVGIKEFLDAGTLSQEQMQNVFSYLAKLFVFQAQQALLYASSQLALPPCGAEFGVEVYRG